MAVKAPAGGLVFVSGALVAQLAGVVERVRAEWKGVPVVVVPAAGVLTERGEIESASAASGILWTGGQATVVAASDERPELGAALAEALVAAAGDRVGTAVLFARPDSFQAEALDALPAVVPKLCILGAGTAGRSAVAVGADGNAVRGRVTGLVVKGMATPVAEASPACRLLGGFEAIDEVEDGMVLRVGGKPALDALSAAAAQLSGQQPLVFAALADDVERGLEDEDAPERFLVRAVRGIDPARRGVLVGNEAVVGRKLAFACRDAAASRARLETSARRVAKLALGAAPRFALYLSCAGRGQGLYGSPDVDVRVLRQRFHDLPIAGMHSSFEIAPWGPGLGRMQLYTGVLALFRSPS